MLRGISCQWSKIYIVYNLLKLWSCTSTTGMLVGGHWMANSKVCPESLQYRRWHLPRWLQVPDPSCSWEEGITVGLATNSFFGRDDVPLLFVCHSVVGGCLDVYRPINLCLDPMQHSESNISSSSLKAFQLEFVDHACNAPGYNQPTLVE